MEILPVRVFEWEVILVGWTIWGKNILDDMESRNSFVALCLSYANKSRLKPPNQQEEKQYKFK